MVRWLGFARSDACGSLARVGTAEILVAAKSNAPVASASWDATHVIGSAPGTRGVRADAAGSGEEHGREAVDARAFEVDLGRRGAPGGRGAGAPARSGGTRLPSSVQQHPQAEQSPVPWVFLPLRGGGRFGQAQGREAAQQFAERDLGL